MHVSGPQHRFKGNFARWTAARFTLSGRIVLPRETCELFNALLKPLSSAARTWNPRHVHPRSHRLSAWPEPLHPFNHLPPFRYVPAPPSNGKLCANFVCILFLWAWKEEARYELPALRKDSTRAPFKISRNSSRCFSGIKGFRLEAFLVGPRSFL